MKLSQLLTISILLLLCPSCNKEPDTSPSKAYIEEFEAYEKQKAEGRIGYLQLCGLLKITDSVLTIGSGAENSFQALSDEIPEQLGILKMGEEGNIFETFGDFEVKTAEGNTSDNFDMSLDENGNSTQLEYGPLKWQIITRSGSPYLRVWDANNPMVERFNGYEVYELNTNYIIEGQFRYFKEEQEQEVPSQLGTSAMTNFIGQLEFDFGGRTHTLDVGRNGFTMVHDETTGEETYGGGRYVYLDLPESDGAVTIDFNRLYNPPCSFSQYTTCLYPPTQNRLDFKIEAGEKLKRKVEL